MNELMGERLLKQQLIFPRTSNLLVCGTRTTMLTDGSCGIQRLLVIGYLFFQARYFHCQRLGFRSGLLDCSLDPWVGEGRRR